MSIIDKIILILDDAKTKGNQDDTSESVENIDRAAYGALPASSRIKTRPIFDSIKLTECYVCTDCPSIELNTTFKQCPYGADSGKDTKCIVYAEQYRRKFFFVMLTYVYMIIL